MKYKIRVMLISLLAACSVSSIGHAWHGNHGDSLEGKFGRFVDERVPAEGKADRPVEVTRTPVRYMSGPDTVRAIIYRPDNAEDSPGVIVIHEWWGLNPWVQKSAERIARKGYVTMAIDLYRGEVATDAETAHELMRGVPEDRAARDLQMAVEYLKVQKGVDAERIGSVGWCMGGGYSLQTALVVPELTACVICYGRLVTEDESISGINASVLGIFGGLDRGIPEESVMKFQEQGRGLGKDVTMHVYDSAGHAFMNPNNKRGFEPTATAKAWVEIFDFLDRTLRPATD